MTKEEFLKISDENKIVHLLTLNLEEEKELLNFLKTKDKTSFFKISGKLKSRKSNSKSEKVLHEIPDKNQIVLLNTESLKDNPYQPRFPVSMSKIGELAASIKKDGLLQPILVNQSDENEYEIISGHTRRDAVVYNKEDKIKAIIYSKLSRNDKNYKSLMLSNALVENIQRNDLDPIELAISFKNALKEKVYANQAALATAIGKQKIYVTKILSILKLSDAILQDLKKNKSIKDIQALYFIQRINNKEIQEQKYFDLVKQKINREDIIEYVKNQNHDIKAIVKSFSIKKNKIEISEDFSRLNKVEKEQLKQELEKVIQKFIN
jgi:ParB family chromosome partitioning protein